MTKRHPKFHRFILVMILTLLLLALVSLTLGDASLTLGQIKEAWIGFFKGSDKTTAMTILFNIRIPRIIAAIFVGLSLASVGCAYQGIFRNSMADPYILGISAGATLGAALTITLGAGTDLAGFGLVTLGAFFGAVLATLLVYSLALGARRLSTTALLLSGVAVSYFLSALVSLILVFNEKDVSKIVYWTMGSLASVSYRQLGLLIPVVLVGFFLLLQRSRQLDLLSFGDEVAQSMGVDVNGLKRRTLLISSFMVAVSVAFTGVIGFVGLMMPHLMRLVTGPAHRKLIPAAALSGSIFLLFADTIARSVIDGVELPVGAITALFGAPYFLYLLYKEGKRRS